MVFKLKDLWKTKYQQIILLSVIVNLGLMYFLGKLGPTDIDIIQTVAVILGITVLLTQTITLKKAKLLNLFIFGAGISLGFNGGGMYLGWFDITFSSLILPALQQGVITVIIAKMYGVK